MNPSSLLPNVPSRRAALPDKAQVTRGFVLGAGAGTISALLTFVGREWYASLARPEWALSVAALALLQLLIWSCAGVALAHLAASSAPEGSKKVVITWFWVTLALCLVWSAAFWGWKSAGWGYTVIMCAWCAVVALIWTGTKWSRTAFWLLVPMFLWITFASSLNFAILSFNTLRQISASMDADPRNANSPADPPIIVKKK